MEQGTTQPKGLKRKKSSATGPHHPRTEPTNHKRLVANDPRHPVAKSPPSSIPHNSEASIPSTQGFFQGAKHFVIENSILADVQGNFMIRFDGPPIEEFRTLASLMQHMAGLVTVKDMDKMKQHGLSQAIRDLPRAKAAYNDYVEDKRRVSCFEGTRQALLEEIAMWLSAREGTRAYLLFGIAGVGKSTVAQTVAEKADNLRLLGASFFFSRDEADRRTAEKFFTSIAFQLCAYDPQFAEAIGAALIEERGAAATTKEPQEQLKALIVEPLRNIVRSTPWHTAIVVDALDECNAEDGPKVLMALDQLVRELPFFKVILTTRPQLHLQYLLSTLSTHQLFRMEEIEGKVVEGDIRRYFEFSLSPEQVQARLPLLRQKWAPNDEDIDAIVKVTGILFIIAFTTVLFILDSVERNPRSRMNTLRDAFSQNRTPFDTLNTFYTVILRSAVPGVCERRIVERYQAVVGTIVLIDDPLPVGALSNLIGMPEDDIYAVLDNLQSVISLGSNGAPLVYHKSFPDYITDDKRCQDTELCIIPSDHHTRLATCCFRIMNRYLKRNVLNLSNHTQYLNNKEALEEEQLSADNLQAIPSELQYASTRWANHVAQADVKDGHLITELKRFTEEHLLHWLEALSWIRKLDTAHTSIGVALKLQIPNLETYQIFSDTLRFVSRDYDKIEQHALYIYYSALPFAPTESTLYKGYRHEALCHVEGGQTQWDVLITEKRHGRLFVSLAFAKNNSRLASWDAHNLKLWDAASGTPIKTFDGKRIALTDDFSVLAVAQDDTVTMHNVSSGAPIASFNHSATIVELAVSFDGSRLATRLEGKAVCMWDVRTSTLIASVDEIDFRPPLTFSPNRHILAFGSKCGISLWNGVDAITRLEHGAERPVQLTFSGDGTRLGILAEKDNEYSLRLWDGEKWDFVAVARDVGQMLAISADGSLVATGGVTTELGVQLWSGDSLALLDTIPIKNIWGLAFSDDMLGVASLSDNGVRLYDIKNRASIGKLQIHNPTSLAFSPDGTRLAAGSYSGTVHLWDIPSIRASATLSKKRSSPVTALALSPDGSRLASGRLDGSVELWNTDYMKQAISCHKLHSGLISALAFSPDGNQLASGSKDKMVRLWDGRDGSLTRILRPSSFTGRLTSLAFSSSLLAAATANIVTLWDRQSLRRIRTLKHVNHALSFSLDGSMLASSGQRHSQCEVVVWNTESFSVTATFTAEKGIIRLIPSSDDAKFVAQYRGTGPRILGVVGKVVISNPEHQDLSCVPHLNGTPISWRGDCLVGRFSARHDCVPMLYISPGFDVRTFSSQSSTFALGCGDGHILLIRPSPNY